MKNKIRNKVKRRKVKKRTDMEEERIKGLEKEIEGRKAWEAEAEKNSRIDM